MTTAYVDLRGIVHAEQDSPNAMYGRAFCQADHQLWPCAYVRGERERTACPAWCRAVGVHHHVTDPRLPDPHGPLAERYAAGDR
jgi:hypothetical protein